VKESLGEIVDQMCDILNPHRYPNHILANPHPVKNLRRNGNVRHRARVLDQRLSTAQRLREREDANRIQKPERLRSPSANSCIAIMLLNSNRQRSQSAQQPSA
jgi:hypothetical protein